MRDWLTILFRYRARIAVVWVSIVLTVAIATAMMPKVYEARTSLLVKSGREHMVNPEVGSHDAQLYFDTKTVVNSEVRILTSDDLLGRLLSEFGPTHVYPDITPGFWATLQGKTGQALDLALKHFREDLMVEPVKDSQVIVLAYRHRDPQLARQIVDRLVVLLTDKHLEVFSSHSVDFLATEARGYQQRLVAAEAKLLQFKQNNQISSLPEQRDLLLKQKSDQELTLQTMQHNLEGLGSRIMFLEGQLQQLPERTVLSSETKDHSFINLIDQAKTELLGLRRKELELLAKFLPTDRLVVEVRQHISLVESFIRDQEATPSDKVTTAVNPLHQELKNQLTKARAELAAQTASRKIVVDQIKRLGASLTNLERLAITLEEQQRELGLHKKNHELYTTKWEEARLSQEMDRRKLANISAIHPASVSNEPVKPKMWLNLVLAVLLGGAVAGTIVMISQAVARKYCRPEEAAADLALPLLGSIAFKR